MSNQYIVFWNEDDHSKLLSWWNSLKNNRGWRAELRRAESPADVLLCQGFRFLYYEMAGHWTKEKNIMGLAAVAGVLAHVDYSDDRSFPVSCASSADGGSKPVMSELRFSQLQKCRSLDELYMRMIRAVRLLGKKANPVSIADSILHWNKEVFNEELESDPRKRIMVCWGLDYFQNLPDVKTKTKDKNDDKQENSKK